MYSISYKNLPYTLGEAMVITIDVNNVTFSME